MKQRTYFTPLRKYEYRAANITERGNGISYSYFWSAEKILENAEQNRTKIPFDHWTSYQHGPSAIILYFASFECFMSERLMYSMLHLRFDKKIDDQEKEIYHNLIDWVKKENKTSERVKRFYKIYNRNYFSKQIIDFAEYRELRALIELRNEFAHYSADFVDSNKWPSNLCDAFKYVEMTHSLKKIDKNVLKKMSWTDYFSRIEAIYWTRHTVVNAIKLYYRLYKENVNVNQRPSKLFHDLLELEYEPENPIIIQH
jgi:hypothetical protein